MDEKADIEVILEGLSSKQKLERDRSLNNLLESIPNYESTFLDCLLFAFITAIKKVDGPWESYHGILQAITALLTQETLSVVDEHHIREIRDAASTHLTHPEVRVRQAAGEVLGSLCAKDECYTYIQLRPKLLHLIQSNLDRDPVDNDSSPGNLQSTLIEKLNNEPRERRNSGGSAAQIFHDTAGWRNLETSMKCLESMIKGCGDKFIPFIDQELLELIFIALSHTNRFVRETGYTVCAALVSCGVSEEDFGQKNPMIVYGDQLAKHLGDGLADNWSQVRLAASEASRKFLMTLPMAARERFFPVLLPRICLNRYYVAEGVRLYSQETWRQVTGNEGRCLVEKYIDYVVPYYIEVTEADNHAVREAACECIAELAQKIPPEAVRPHVNSLLQALKVCFNDDSWPVRDAACLACGNFIGCFPDESSAEMETLFPLFFNNLQDNIPSVRQGAASALFSVVKVYTDQCFPKVREYIEDALKGVEKQPSESIKYSDLDTGPATYGVVKQKRDNDIDLHSNNQMYSCGSLAPKMGRGGCSDCRFRRPSQQWERADGCLYLVAELSKIASIREEVVKLLPLVASATSHKHYTAHLTLLETLCKTLPIVAKELGKKLFKPKLSLFFNSIFYSLGSENALTSSAARQCLSQLGHIIGPNILRGRIEEFDPSFLKAFDASINLAPL